MSIEHVTQICQHLKNSGKTPTTALVKAKAAPGTPLALIIKGIQRFKASQIEGDTNSQQQTDIKNNVDVANVDEASPSQAKFNLEQLTQLAHSQQRRIEQLEKFNQLLQAELKDIQKQVQALSIG
ncbi:hypothetical protein [Glaciecola petra]|uniref:KfrA N-terminal DNA-binding domain-containing protein n=1 Tax=Glaciecola petra TaxID=3075602 RepID=A0ABU2ZM30_9ALTE|nr:hypothetical protein [Aestuariibacter sp. P117]MDT0593685.1 hypothetical protein [Aestuariibacter sp. P117]